MKFRGWILSFFCLIFSSSYASDYLFIENKGQWPTEVLYRVQIPSGFLWVTSYGLKYHFFSSNTHLHYQKNDHLKLNAQPEKQQVVFLHFPNILEKSKLSKTPVQHYNFFMDEDSKKWVSNVGGFSEIQIENVFPQIDFRMYGTDQSLKYEYIVKPGGKVSDIKINIEGSNDYKIIDEELVFETVSGTMKEFRPFSFQKTKNGRQVIGSSFTLIENQLGFKMGDYDKSQPLIIDPELVFSSYTGSFSDNWSHTATYDSKGNLYAGGTAFGSNYPTTVGVFQPKDGGTTLPGDSGYRTDVVITKYASDGKSILYSTFLGGQESEVPHSLIVNSKDQLVVFGTTSSKNFPTTTSAFGRQFKGGERLIDLPITTNIAFFSGTDIFVSLISEDGKALLGSTLVGGGENDGIHDLRALPVQNYGDEFRGEVVVDKQDNIWVASVSTSNDFPLVKSFQTKKSVYDGVVFQLSPDLRQMLFSSFIGGNDYDAAYSLKVNDLNEVFICGVTLSNNFPVTSTAFKRNRSGDSDAWIAKIKDQKLVSATYLGTDKGEIGSFLDLDSDNNVYVLGLSTGEYPVSQGVYSNKNSGQFIHCLNNNLTGSLFSSVFGSGQGIGKVDLAPTAFMVNNCGNIYVAGWGGKVNSANDFNLNSTTKGLPITDNALRKTTTGNNYYIAIFEKGLKSLLFGTYYGSNPPANIQNERGDHLDGGTCRFDKNGVIYHSACVCKATGGFVDFPLKNAAQASHNSTNCNMAAFKIDLNLLSARFDLNKDAEINPEKICAPAAVKFQNKSEGGETYDWYLDGKRISSEKNIEYRFENEGLFEIKLFAYNKITCKTVDSTRRLLKVNRFDYSTSNDTTVCAGGTVNLSASGGLKYEWTPKEGIVNDTLPSISARVYGDKVFSVKIISEECSITENINVKVENLNEDFKVSPDLTLCKGKTAVLIAEGLADRFVWSSEKMADSTQQSITVKPETSKTYVVKAYYPNGCEPSKTVKVDLDASVNLDFKYEYRFECQKPAQLVFENLSRGGQNYTWTLGNQQTVIAQNFQELIANRNESVNMQLMAKSITGCEFVINKPVEIFNYDGIIPNAITPNNDKKNDTFVIGYPPSPIEIFDSWGKKIWKTNEYNNDWGTGVPAGSYYYLLKIPNGQQCKGWIEVID